MTKHRTKDKSQMINIKNTHKKITIAPTNISMIMRKYLKNVWQ